MSDFEYTRIDVCVCTFRRPSIIQTLASIAAQTYGRDNIRVIVADNDHTNAAQETIERAAKSLGLEMLYVHAPQENISIARNACVDAVTAQRFAFIDDDECAEPRWLESLVKVMELEKTDVVFGPVDAVYAESTPKWWGWSELHNTRPTILKDRTIVTGYTCNVLLRAASLNGLRFRLDFGKSGGEDTLFFHDLHCGGAQFAYAPEAKITETVAANRLRLKWLLARTFLGGQLHMSMSIIDRRPLWLIVAASIVKLTYSLVLAVLNLGDPAQWRRNLMRASLHVGVLARGLGYREILRKNN